MTNKQMEKKLRRAFQRATPNRTDASAVHPLLSETENRKGVPMKPVKTNMQFRLFTGLAATAAVVALILGVTFLPKTGANPAAGAPGPAQNGIVTQPAENHELGVVRAIETLNSYLAGMENAPASTENWDWEFQLVGDILVYEFEIEAEPNDFIAHVYPDGKVLSWYEDDAEANSAHGRFVGLDAAMEAAKEYAAANELSLDPSSSSFNWDLETEDGKYTYELEYRLGVYEITFWVDAVTGVVLHHETEFKSGFIPSATTDAQGNTEGPPPTTLPSGSISRDEALQIALKHANLKEADVWFTIDVELDDAVPNYDIEIYFGKDRYEYEIRLSDGAILDADVDYEKDATTTTDPPDGKIPSNVAINLALEHVGIDSNASQGVSHLECEADSEDGVKHYDVSFHYNGYSYELEIGMYNAIVISVEKETID